MNIRGDGTEVESDAKIGQIGIEKARKRIRCIKRPNVLGSNNELSFVTHSMHCHRTALLLPGRKEWNEIENVVPFDSHGFVDVSLSAQNNSLMCGESLS